MTSKEITKTVYVADDGREFTSKVEAEAYEDAINQLALFQVSGPEYVPYQEMRKIGYNWNWYKANNVEELKRITNLLGFVSNNVRPLFLQDNESEFPDYIGYDRISRDTVSYSMLNSRHKTEEAVWRSFQDSFPEIKNKKIREILSDIETERERD